MCYAQHVYKNEFMIMKVTNKMQLYRFTQVAAGCQLAATWVNTTGSCKNSQVLLMMGKNIAQNT
jgi:hypothetical protein